MSVPATHEASLRPGRFEHKRLAWAFAISLAVHLLSFGGYEFGINVLPGIVRRVKFLAALAHLLHLEKKNPTTPQESEPPLVFVDVNPQTATTEAPKNAQYYSSRNSQAANSDADVDSTVPKISGEQIHVPKTEDAARSTPDKLQPDFSAAQREQSKPKQPPGDLTMAKPDVTLRPENNSSEHVKPRTLSAVHQLAGQKMKQEGGVRQHLQMSSLDAKATPFGSYDAAFIEAVQQRWYDLLDSIHFSFDRHGKVTLQFHLNYDGTISDMKVAGNTVDGSMDGIMGVLCQRAVRDPAPFEKWPREMRLMMEKDYREIQFTFYYD